MGQVEKEGLYRQDANNVNGKDMRVGLRDMEWVEEVCDRLKKGASLGCKG